MDDDSPWRDLRRSTRQLLWMMAAVCALTVIEFLMVFRLF
jgi:hypothetical protein